MSPVPTSSSSVVDASASTPRAESGNDDRTRPRRNVACVNCRNSKVRTRPRAMLPAECPRLFPAWASVLPCCRAALWSCIINNK